MAEKKEKNIIVGQRLKDYRERRNMTVSDCCIHAGVSESAWRMYEAGKRMPRDDVKKEIARMFNRTVQFIFYRE